MLEVDVNAVSLWVRLGSIWAQHERNHLQVLLIRAPGPYGTQPFPVKAPSSARYGPQPNSLVPLPLSVKALALPR